MPDSLVTSSEAGNITDKTEHEDFKHILQGQALNALTKVKTKNLLKDKAGNAGVKVDNNFSLTIKEYSTLPGGIPITAFMLLDCFVIHFTNQPIKSVCIRLPLSEYMDMRRLSDVKAAREQVLRDIEALKKIEYQAREKIRGKWVQSGSVSLYGGTGYIKNGIIHFNFNADFFNTLLTYRIMDYSVETLRLNPKQHPHAYFLSRYIDVNYRVNEGENRVKTISVATLIKNAPYLPTRDEVMKSASYRGNIYNAIIEPIVRDLDSIERLYYDFIDENGVTIDDPLNTFKGIGGFERFISSRIQVDYSDYEKHPKRIERKRVHTARASKTRASKKKTTELETRIAALEDKRQGLREAN